jgi:ketosteroid isomerase-like protein
MSSLDLVRRFVDTINAHDVEGLATLMAEDHRFIDSLGSVFAGRATMQAGWTEYFKLFPDYTIAYHTAFERDGVVALFGSARGTFSGGTSSGSPSRWEIPAAWRAIVRDKHVVEWQVYADNDPVRQIMAL